MNFYIRNCRDLQSAKKIFFNTQLKSMRVNFILQIINASLHKINLRFSTKTVN